MRKMFILPLIIIILVGGLGAFFVLSESRQKESPALSNNSSVSSVPVPQGNESEKINLIKITKPQSKDLVASPLAITGEARGNWFFEAVFPIKLVDQNGKLLASVQARALSEWTTENFVPFQAELQFQKPETQWGTLVLEKDNPSGLPEKADELRMPVRFY